MRLDVEIYEAGSYLLMKAAGQYSLVDLTGLFDRAGQEAEKRAYAEVLLDLNAVENIGQFKGRLALEPYLRII